MWAAVSVLKNRHLETIARTQEVISVAVQPAAFFRRAGGNGGSLAASISSSEHHLIKNTSNDYCSNDQSNELLSFFYHLLSFVYGEHQTIWPIVFRFNWTISLNPHRLMSAPLKLSNLLFDLHKSIYFFQFPKMCRKTISQIPQSLEKNGRKIGHPNLPSHAQHGGLPRGNLKSSIAREEPSASTLLRCSRTWGG